MENLERKRTVFGLTKEERKKIEIEDGLESLSKYLDDWIKIPVVGWRFGLDALIGLIPNVGDTVTSFGSFYILVAGVRYGVPKITLLRMAFNIGLDYVVGVIPFVGDAFDFFWKSNKQNMDLIRERGTGKGQGTTGDYIFVFGIILLLIGILVGSILVSLYILGTVFAGLWDLVNF
ncbi:MAG: DUF4112 domain-containing protein [Acidobacteriota bacterium]|nr:DUF4112 domain-containing protein [Acidobacteriota bacterium]